MLYTLNLYSAVCQVQGKNRKKRNKNQKIFIAIPFIHKILFIFLPRLYSFPENQYLK